MGGDARQLIGGLRAADRAGVLLDVDGTLAPIVASPEDAALQAGAREVLERLVNTVAILVVITGRPTPEGSAMVGVEGVTVLGSYGLGDLPPVPTETVDEVERIARAFPGARIERKGGTLAVHLRGTPEPDTAEAALMLALSPVAARAGMDVARGKRVLELVPAGRDLKGEAVDRTLAQGALDAVLYAGDDLADLGAFAALDRAAERGTLTIKVAVRGPETPPALISAADLIVEGPEGMVGLLGQLI